MQALRLARPTAAFRRPLVRTLAATAGSPPAGAPSSQAVVPLSNVEAQWERLSADEQLTVHQQLEEIQKKDWKTLSIDEKKAAYYVAFGPHGPRAPVSPPGEGMKVLLWTMAGVAVSGVLYVGARYISAPPPRTLTKEWEEAMNERAIQQKMNPIHGIASEGYKGVGFVQHK